jgi:ribosome-associated heat shock protein Hsp15
MRHEAEDDDTRLDKWLWAARFFKTRSLAIQGINGGKVRVNDERAKPSKKLLIGMTVAVNLGQIEKTVIVRKLSERRGPAVEAEALYEETPESVQKREQHAEQRRLMAFAPTPEGRPDKKQRRQLRRVKQQLE